MIIRKQPTDPSQSIEDEREWQAQESAREEQRHGVANVDNDALAARYRAISEVLRKPPIAAIPPDFAARVARHAETAREAADEGLERVLTQTLLALLGLSAAAISTLYGAQWLHALGQAMPSASGAWAGLLTACGVLHWMLDRLQRRVDLR